MFYKIFNTLLAFFILFAFPVAFVHNSTVLAAILIIALRPKSLFSLAQILREKYVRKIIYLLFFIIFLSFFTALIHQTLEFDIIRPLANQSFIFFTVLLFFASLHKKTSIDESHWYLMNAYLLQSIIILLAYNIPFVEDFVRSFQTKEIIEIGSEGYLGFRALSISGGQFFWIAGAYAMLFLMITFKFLEKKQNLWAAISFIIIIAGSLFTGRTIFIGLLFSLILFFINGNFKGFLKTLFYAGITGVFLVFILPQSFFDSSFYQWAFELFINYNETGSFSTTSTDGIFEVMLYVPELKTILFGDGLWASAGGGSQAFYGGTDSGFIRVLLFYGVGGVALYFLYARFIVFGLSRTTQLNNKLGLKFLYTLLFFQLVLNIKGQSLSYMTSTQAVLFMFFIPYVINKVNNR